MRQTPSCTSSVRRICDPCRSTKILGHGQNLRPTRWWNERVMLLCLSCIIMSQRKPKQTERQIRRQKFKVVQVDHQSLISKGYPRLNSSRSSSTKLKKNFNCLCLPKPTVAWLGRVREWGCRVSPVAHARDKSGDGSARHQKKESSTVPQEKKRKDAWKGAWETAFFYYYRIDYETISHCVQVWTPNESEVGNMASFGQK